MRETGLCYPDIELLPTIAAFFGISTDKLMGVDETAEKEAVNRYLNDFQKAISKGEIDKCISIAREGVAEYPNNYVLLDKLMYALFVSGDEDGNIPDWKKNMEKYDAEITALGERIMKYCSDTEIRLEATARLAFQHCEMGRTALGRSVYETLPSIMQCRETAIWWALSDDEKLPHTRDLICKAYDVLNSGIYLLAGLLPDKEALEVLKKKQSLKDLIYDNDTRIGTWGNANDHYRQAKYGVKLNRISEAFECLNIAADSAVAFDNRPDEERTTSLLLGEQIHKKTDYDTTDSRPLREIMRDKWLASEDFDSIRNTAEFSEIIERLS